MRFLQGLSPAAVASLVVASLAAAPLSAASAQVIVIQNAELHTMAGAGVIENGDVVIRDGEIAAVGEDLTPPAGATVIDAEGLVATPGFIAPYSSFGLSEIGLDRESNDAGPRRGEGFELSAALDAADAFNPTSTLVAVNRAGGITRALSAPQAGDKLFAGQGAVVDLSGDPSKDVLRGAAQIVVMGYGGASRAGDTRMGAWTTLRDTLDEARIYASNPRDYYRRARDDRFAFSDLSALGSVIAGEQPLFVLVDGAADIRNLIALKSEYDLNVVIVGGSEAWRVARQVSAASIPVILNPFANLPGQFEDLGATLTNAAQLHAAGVSVSFFGPPSGAHNLRALPQLAGNAVANGLPHKAALAGLTINAARAIGVDDRLGSLEVGKAADLVLWDGDPLETMTRPVRVIIDGADTSLETRQTRLRDRYRDLSRGDLPHAYRGGQ